MADGYRHILFTAADGIATLTLNRPDRLNALTPEAHEEIADAVARAANDGGVRVLLLTGAGRAFCTGQDLGERIKIFEQGAVPDLGESLDRYYNPLIRSLRRTEMPVVCAVNGPAAGAGANLALACDIVVAARSASFVEAFCKVGLIPDSGGTYHLPRLVGRARAAGMMLLGEPVRAEQAEAWGLIWKCVEDESLMAEAGAIAQRLAEGPATALALTKKALTASLDNDLDSQLALERDLQREAGRHPDYHEGVSAFVEKRWPNFGSGE